MVKKTKKDLTRTALVEKRNVLNEIRNNNMTLQELRFFSIYLSKINARDISTRVVRFSLGDFQKIMELGTDMNISHFRMTTRRLLQQIVEVPNESGHGYNAFQIFKECKVEKDDNNEWYVEINAHDKALMLMFDFKRNYFTYELWNALKLKSANQIRMYEILKQYEHLGKREISVQELRELLNIEKNEYARFERFRVRVLDSCQQALSENTDIKFSYERGKIGRGGKWLTIIFTIEKNTHYKDPLTLEEFIDIQQVKAIPPASAFEHELTEELNSKYSNDIIAGLAEICNNEFTEAEMRVIQSLIAKKQLEPDELTGSIRFSREIYLADMYNRLCLVDESGRIRSTSPDRRFKYLCGMLRNEI